MTGSRFQWYNGMMLLSVFFCCRLVWGTWQSVIVYKDMWNALQQTWSAASSSPLATPVNIGAHVFTLRDGGMCVDETCARANAEIARFKDFTAGGVPTWLVLTYVASNIILNFLNYFWFSKMVDTVLKRFRGPPADAPEAKKLDQTSSNVSQLAQDAVLGAASTLEENEDAALRGEKVSSALDTGISEDLRRRRTDLIADLPGPGS